MCRPLPGLNRIIVLLSGAKDMVTDVTGASEDTGLEFSTSRQ
jgi:hypothetical protein